LGLQGKSPVAPADELVPIVYAELRSLAAQYLRQERPGHTLQPTALVNEAYLRLRKLDEIRWRDKNHFLAVAAQIMRQILVSHGRRRAALKRRQPDFELPAGEGAPERAILHDAAALDEALRKLEARNPEVGKAIELRFFAGLSPDEIAEYLGCGRATVYRQLQYGRAWLLREMNSGAA
jgi:RNA polymerase sigma factor (TIGR02999 family)